MTIRETYRKRPALVASSAAAVVLIAAIVLVRARSAGGGPGGDARAYYSADGGQTYFADDATLAVPFDRDGRQSVRAYVFRCGGGAPYVGYLERYTDAGRRRLAQLGGRSPTQAAAERDDVMRAESQVKKPGSAEWAAAGTKQWEAIANPRCPDGRPAETVAP